MEALARLGGDVDAAAYPGVFDATPVNIVVQEGHTAVIEALGRFGADVNRAENDGFTPVHTAALGGHAAVIELLGRLGADVNRADNNHSLSPLGLATRMGNVAAADALRRLGAEEQEEQ